MNPCFLNEPMDLLIMGQVGIAEMMGKFQEELPPKNFIPVHIPNVLELRLHCEQKLLKIKTNPTF